MKIIIKKFMSEETLVELTIEDPSTTTINEFAHSFFDKVNQTKAYVIEPTRYTERDYIIPEDFHFYCCGRQFTSADDRVYGFNNSSKSLSMYVPSDQQECVIYANLSVFGKQDYCLNSHLNIFSRVDALNNQLTDLQTSTLKGFVGFKNNNQP